MSLLLDRVEAQSGTTPAQPVVGQPSRSVRIGAHRYPVFLPNICDSRLHVAAVVMTIHTLGQTVLHFRVSVVQIFAAIFTCFVIEIAVVFGREKVFRWPASAMLTGSGVGLIMRLPTMKANTPWATTAWWMYSAVAGLSLVTKYVIRDRGRHIFNPSNLGLVFVFIVLGSHFAEPLDFWWAPVNAWMLFAYALIIAGGSFVARRIGLLPMAATFWATLAVGLAAIAVSGHSIYSPSSLHPVAGWHFWWLVLTSPETLIFVYFMLSDPKTVPRSRHENMLFGFTVALVATLLIAPQRSEFGTKVALLGALTICSVLRAIVPRLPALRAALTLRPHRSIAVSASALGFVGVALVGVGARPLGEVLDGRRIPVVPANLVVPPLAIAVTVSPEAKKFDSHAAVDAQQVGQQLVSILATERAAVRTGHPEWFAGVSYGRRRQTIEMQYQQASGQALRTAVNYTFASLKMVVIPSRSEGANRLGFAATGTMSETEFATDGTVTEVNPHPFNHVFVLRKTTDRYVLVDEVNQETSRRASLQ
jgi:hypothetical protein